jgi:hypothetical protein
MSRTRKSSYTPNKRFQGHHRFEHWYRDNQVYFITARCRDRFLAFASEAAKQVFWDRFTHYTRLHGFEPWVTTLLDNHYHVVGYLHRGEDLGPMMRKLHGSVAKLVNDLLPQRLLPFWHDRRHHDYFDGCLRNVKQLRLSFRYTLTQAVRHRVCSKSTEYPHTAVNLELDRAMDFAQANNALLFGVPYARYGSA